MTESTIPKEIIKELELQKPSCPPKEVTIIFDKGQAVVRIPTYFNDVIRIVKGSRFKISLIEGEPALKLELVK